MKRNAILLMVLAAVIAAGWLAFRSPDSGGEKKGVLKERLRATESATQTLDAERAVVREKLRLARKTADENRARSMRAAAALPFFEKRRREAELNLAEMDRPLRADVHNKLCTHSEGSARWAESATGMSHLPETKKRRADGTEQTAADNADHLRRLNALLQ